jgi:hypothetical protein
MTADSPTPTTSLPPPRHFTFRAVAIRDHADRAGCRFLNAETQNINVRGMLFLPADGMLPAKLRDEGPKL